MNKLMLFLPLLLSGCAVYDWAWHPVPDAAYAVARGNRVAHCKMKVDSLTGAYARFERLYDVVSERFGPTKIARRKEGAKVFSPDLFCRWEQTDEHLAVDLYVEDWRKHDDPSFWEYGIVVDICMRDFRKQDAQTKARLIREFGKEGARKHLDKDGNLLK